MKLERRFARGMSLLASYTFSKSIDNSSDFGSGDSSEQVLDSSHLALERAVSSFDVPHRLSSTITWELPFNSSRPFSGRLIRGWQTNAIITLQSGQPFTPYVSNFDPFRNEAFNRPDVVGDPNANIPPGFAFNPAVFRIPAPGTFGSAGRNIVRGDGFHSVDLSLFRNFAFTERWRLQLRAEAVNSFNQVILSGSGREHQHGAGNFYRGSAASDFQFGLKLTY